MKIDIEEIGPCTKQLKIEVPFETYTKEEEKAYKELSGKVKVPGFRKGKVPRSYLQKTYHSHVKNDVLNKIIPESYYKVVEEKGLKPIGPPKLENVTQEKDSPITFTATIEIIPSFEIKNFEELEVTKKIIQVTDEDINRELDYIKNSYAAYEVITGRPTKKGDLAIIDFKGFVDGAPLEGGETKNFPLEIGSKSLMEDFEKGVIGMNQGEEKDIPVVYPADYNNKELAGKNVVLKVKVNEIKIKKLPEITDQFIKDEMGKDITLNDLKEEVKQHQTKRDEMVADSNLRTDVLNKLIEMNPMEIPQVLVDDQINFMAEEFKNRMRLQGIKDDAIKIEKKKFHDEAVRVIKGELIQQKISEVEKIHLDQAEIDGPLDKLAIEKKMTKQKLIISMQKDGSYNNLLNNLQRKKTMDFVLSKLKIKEVVVDREAPNKA